MQRFSFDGICFQPMGDDGHWERIKDDDDLNPIYGHFNWKGGNWTDGDPWCEKPAQPDYVPVEGDDLREYSLVEN